jgi:hypothetical protein
VDTQGKAHLPNEDMLNGISRGWPAVLASLKSLLETGGTLTQQLLALPPDGVV